MAKSLRVGAIGIFFLLFKRGGFFFSCLGSGMGMGEGAKTLLNNLGSALLRTTMTIKSTRIWNCDYAISMYRM
jgi:hypothetical protein